MVMLSPAWYIGTQLLTNMIGRDGAGTSVIFDSGKGGRSMRRGKMGLQGCMTVCCDGSPE
jgi:hypothetical protein